MSALLDLAERCEAATGPDRELDARISAAIRGREFVRMETAERLGESGPGGWYYTGIPDLYTTSLDAAMTLASRYGVLLHLSDIGADGLPLCNIGDSETAREFKGIGTANLALAVCAAALRARAAQDQAA